ncbi:MAG: hypothetical protein A2705_02835 [Omnitrophica WOR_2 bacterium RIFCSPHIGHO2_01_FULL_52_10]|nr:MAG: hypothetical protein A2705_02835 [Omnitrophica WOR_2 bacterium RIFCSPHIGHO2_01_FULL_52_10]
MDVKHRPLVKEDFESLFDEKSSHRLEVDAALRIDFEPFLGELILHIVPSTPEQAPRNPFD